MPAGNIAAAARPPLVLRGRLLTPRPAGGTQFNDVAVAPADATGRLCVPGRRLDGPVGDMA